MHPRRVVADVAIQRRAGLHGNAAARLWRRRGRDLPTESRHAKCFHDAGASASTSAAAVAVGIRGSIEAIVTLRCAGARSVAAATATVLASCAASGCGRPAGVGARFPGVGRDGVGTPPATATTTARQDEAVARDRGRAENDHPTGSTATATDVRGPAFTTFTGGVDRTIDRDRLACDQENGATAVPTSHGVGAGRARCVLTGTAAT